MRKSVLVGTVSGLVFLTAACGGSSGASSAKPTSAQGSGVAGKSPSEILAAARRALTTASSVHVHGAMSEGGETNKLDFYVGKDRSRGEATTPNEFVTAPFSLIAIGGKIYIKGRDFWKQVGGPEGERLVGDRWGYFPTTHKNAKSYEPLTSLTGITEALLKPSGTPKNTGPTTIDGQAAVELKNPDGGRLYISSTGLPHMLRFIGSHAKAGEGIDFSEWNAPLTVTAPADAVDVSNLKTTQK